MRRALLSILLLVPALAGCTSDSDSGVPGTGVDGETDDGPFQLGMPEWQVGDWWSYETTFGSYTLVVSEGDGTLWMIDTDDEDLAFFHSTMGEISYLGDIRRSDLAGFQDGDAVRFFDWPLEHNKEWMTRWDGMDLDMVSHVDEATGVAHIAASIDGTAINNIVYDSGVGWFRSISWGDPETGDEQFRMDLKDSGSDFSDELVRVTPTLVFDEEYGGLQNDVKTLDVQAGEDADAYLMYTVECGSGAFAFGAGTFEGSVAGNTGADATEPQGRSIASPCPFEESFAGVIGTAPGNGDQWGMYHTSESQDLRLEIRLYIREFERISF